MKKAILALCIGLTVVHGTAVQAVPLNRDGSGQVLIIPDSGPLMILPRPAVSPSHPFCWQTTTLHFGEAAGLDTPSPILGALPPVQSFAFADMADEGRFRISFDESASVLSALREPLAGVRLRGIPVTGFFVTGFDNAFVEGGTLANYAASFRHHIGQSLVDP